MLFFNIFKITKYLNVFFQNFKIIFLFTLFLCVLLSNSIKNYSLYNIMNNTENLFKKLPYELINLICEYDGRIKYKYKQTNHIDYHKFVNVIHKYDERYNIISSVIDKKKDIIMNTYVSPVDTSFFFEVTFDNQPNLILCYDYNWSYNNQFEICYTNLTWTWCESDQIRTVYK